MIASCRFNIIIIGERSYNIISINTTNNILGPDSLPVNTSPSLNEPSIIPTSIISVTPFHSLTLAVVPEIEPVTISLNVNVPPIPVVLSTTGGSIRTIGVVLYPSPPSTM